MAQFEIVPNLSEGRVDETIDAAVIAVEATGARVLHRTSDAVHNRTVLTIAGDERQVLDASVALTGVAVERIDLRQHRGVHPRVGAFDVLPFVPLEGATLHEAAALAHEAGEQIWQRYRVPVYFYGAAARKPNRVLLADVRKGEFEGLDARAGDPAWIPDIGDRIKHESAGVVCIGAREILIAFNVELATGDVAIAREIASQLRERDGGLRGLRALGLVLNDHRVQVSLNVTDYHATPLQRIVELIDRLAAQHGVRVVNSELVGCLPRAAVESAALYYLGVAELELPTT
jgi:glutamate formiminotransferase / 5-formyltetrahydrofolate cyclo-ligase